MKFCKLSALMFFEYAVWGGYITTLGVYLLNVLNFTPLETAFIYSFFGLAAIFAMPAAGFIADRLFSATYLYSILLLLCGVSLLLLAAIRDKNLFFIVFAIGSFAYMPTLALSNTIAFSVLETSGGKKDRHFVAVKAFGTIGFILAIWLVSFLGWSAADKQFYIAAAAAFITALLGLMQKKVPVLKRKGEIISFKAALPPPAALKRLLWIYGLAVCLGLLVQVDNIYANKFLSDIKLPFYAFWGSFAQISGLLVGIALIFIIAAVKIEYLLLAGIAAWAVRFFSFAWVDLSALGYAALAVSILSFGIAYKFFTNGAAIYVSRYAPPQLQATAQALFLMLYNGIGGALGGFLTSFLISRQGDGKSIPWHFIWNFYGFYAAFAAACAAFCVILWHYNREA